MILIGPWRQEDASGISALEESDIVIAVAEDGAPRLVIARENGEVVPVPGADGLQRPTISPERDRIAALERLGSGAFRPWLLELSTGERQPLLGPGGDARCPSSARAAWDPDGDRIALVCSSEDGEESLGVWLIELDAEGAVATGEALVPGESGPFGPPEWSARDVLYLSQFEPPDEPAGSSIYSVDLGAADPGEPVVVVQGTPGTERAWLRRPDWCGDRLLYVTSEHRSILGEAWVGDSGAEGTSLGIVTDTAVWSPDCRQVAWTDDERVLKTAALGPDGRLESEESRLEAELVGIPAWG